MEKIKTEELHPILLNIAKEFHRICNHNGIRYWMVGGTQLGSVRHKGFIPWDDDMDFGVLTDDWDKLLAVLKDELPYPYRVRTIDNCSKILTNTLKIEDCRTIINPDVKSKREEDNIGVNIDVFPLVYTSERKDFLSKNWWIAFLIKVQYWRFCDYKNAGVGTLVSKIVKVTCSWLRKGQITHYINKNLITNQGNCITNFWGRWILNEIIPVSIFGEPKLYIFEDTEFYGVEKYHDYLVSLYGDYMKLPPENKRNLHIKNMYWK